MSSTAHHLGCKTGPAQGSKARTETATYPNTLGQCRLARACWVSVQHSSPEGHTGRTPRSPVPWRRAVIAHRCQACAHCTQTRTLPSHANHQRSKSPTCTAAAGNLIWPPDGGHAADSHHSRANTQRKPCSQKYATLPQVCDPDGGCHPALPLFAGAMALAAQIDSLNHATPLQNPPGNAHPGRPVALT